MVEDERDSGARGGVDAECVCVDVSNGSAYTRGDVVNVGGTGSGACGGEVAHHVATDLERET